MKKGTAVDGKSVFRSISLSRKAPDGIDILSPNVQHPFLIGQYS